MALITPMGSALTTTALNRAYYGSDTRAQSLLVGAALAAVTLLWGPVRTAVAAGPSGWPAWSGPSWSW